MSAALFTQKKVKPLNSSKRIKKCPLHPLLARFAEAVDVRKHLLTLSLSRPRKDAEVILKTHGLFIYGDLHYITKSFCENTLTAATIYPRLWTALFVHCSYYCPYTFYQQIFILHCVLLLACGTDFVELHHTTQKVLEGKILTWRSYHYSWFLKLLYLWLMFLYHSTQNILSLCAGRIWGTWFAAWQRVIWLVVVTQKTAV